MQEFKFADLFRENLGWNKPPSNKPAKIKVKDTEYTYRQIALLGGVLVFEIESVEALTNKSLREAIHKEISKLVLENLVIFTDKLDQPRQSLWYWVKRDGKRKLARDHLFVKGQTGDLFISKIAGMFVDISELDEYGNIPVTEAARRLEGALDVETVTKKFYKEFSDVRLEFTRFIEGISDPKDKAHYASVLMHRLMFIYFLQRKGFLGVEQGNEGTQTYLQEKLKDYGSSNFYQDFLQDLFFEGFAKPEENRSKEVRNKIGKIKYLNGGLFLRHRIENTNKNIQVSNSAFENLFELFTSYSWNLDDTPSGKDNEINPDVLGYIFEKYINQKAFGAYYTRPEITEYLCKQTIEKLILEKINDGRGVVGLPQKTFSDYNAMLVTADANLCRELLDDILPKLALLDPACGSGAFLIAALKTLMDTYGAILGRIEILNDPYLTSWKARLQGSRVTVNYVLKRRIVTDNLYGVDLMPEATDIARLRLFLAMVSSANSVQELEPLPNIDFNVLSGNSLIGLMHIDEAKYNKEKGKDQLAMFDSPEAGLSTQTYTKIIEKRRRELEIYRHHAERKTVEDLQELRDDLERGRVEAIKVLNPMLLEEFGRLGIKFEQASWDTATSKEGKTKKRALELQDILMLEPFHWGFEFSEVMDRGGFDAIIANPPWDILKPNDKEFLQDHDDTITINKMGIKELEEIKNKLLKKPSVCKEYESYLSRFPHQSAYYRAAPQFGNQSSVVNGKKTGTDINLYKLFLEQCFNLLSKSGHCGIVIPSGIYTDLGAKGLREMLFEQTTVTGLFGFENRKEIFEGVHRSFKFVVLSFSKHGSTTAFPAAFMRLNVSDLDQFPEHTGLTMQVELVKRLSPDSMSIMEFQSEQDVKIAEKMLKYPLLGEKLENTWNLKLTNEFHMTNDSHLFKTSSSKGRLPLFEGKIIHQFTHTWGEPKYWIDEKEARAELLSARVRELKRKLKQAELDLEIPTEKIQLDYTTYRIAFRDVARNTDERSMIATVLPPNVFCPHTMSLEQVFTDNVIDDEIELNITTLTHSTKLYLTSIFNSFTSDYLLRQRITAHVSFFYIYQIPVPRLTSRDSQFKPIVTRAAKLICTTPEFDDLAKSAGLKGHQDGATIPAERAKLRAELDGLIAHLYGLTETEFAHILETFPLVPDGVRLAARNAYRDVVNGLVK